MLVRYQAALPPENDTSIAPLRISPSPPDPSWRRGYRGEVSDLRSAEGTPRAGAMDVVLRATGELSEADHQERQQLSLRVNGPPEARSGSAARRLTWAGIDDTLCTVTVRHEGRLVSSLFVNARTILVNERAVYAGGI